jgi:hypothetical protein
VRVSPHVFPHACKLGNVASVEMSVAVMDVNTSSILTLPLHQVIKSDNAAIIDCVIDADADINHRQYFKKYKEKEVIWEPECPLEFATTRSLRAVEILLKRRATVPPPGRWCWTEK